jgi:GT2 family glycosyltransferase
MPHAVVNWDTAPRTPVTARVDDAAELLLVTPTLGRSPWLAEMVASVAAHAPGAVHVLVGPALVGRDLQHRFPQTRFVAENGRGLYTALNTGLHAYAAEKWRWFAYLNDDDLLEAGGVRAAIRAAVSARGGDVVAYGRVRLIDGQSRPLGELPIARRPRDLRVLLERGIVPLAQPGTIVHRSVVERLGGFDPSYRSAGDLDFFVRALDAGTAFVFVSRVLGSFRLHDSQISKDEKTAILEKERALETLRRSRGRSAMMALVRFRLANLGVYAGRIRRFGFVRMKEVYRGQ